MEDLWTVNRTATLFNYGVADLADQDYKACWGIVVLGVVPNEQDSVHDWHEGVCNVAEFLSAVSDIQEEALKS